MKLNCDMGESFGSWSMGMDSAVMPYIDMANIACGFHASDPVTMHKTIKLAVAHDVSIGAHPGYPDLLGFGRREIQCSEQELFTSIVYQLGALDGLCRIHGTKIEYVKPHGALYNKMMVHEETLRVIMKAVRTYSPHCPLVLMATPNNQRMSELAETIGIEVMFEAFSDRAYDDDGLLVDRTIPGAVHETSETIEKQVLQIINEKSVTSISGEIIQIQADTVCVHGDSLKALEAARHIRQTFKSL